jgi:hypothetical protein
MADRTNFGVTGSGSQGVPALRCPEAEPLFTGYIDGSLDAAVRARLQLHLDTCPPCAAELKLVEKGLAWLKILRHDEAAVQPPAGLVEKILARTTSQEQASTLGGVVTASSVPARGKPWSKVNLAAIHGNMRRTGLIEPRLMLTAAMAFFSISITLNVAGIRLNDLRPMNLRHTVNRTYSDTSAHVVRYYENMRVVYQLESRVRELRRAAEASDANRLDHQNQQAPKARPNKTQTAPQSNTGKPSSSSSVFPNDGVAGKSRTKKKDEPDPVPVSGDVLEASMNFSGNTASSASAAPQRSEA